MGNAVYVEPAPSGAEQRGPAAATGIVFSEWWHFQMTAVARAAKREEVRWVHLGLGLSVTTMGQGMAREGEPLRVTPHTELSGQM